MITQYFAAQPRPPPTPNVTPPPARVVAAFDSHELSLRPWRSRGYQVTYDQIDDLSVASLREFAQRNRDAAFVIATPPCTDLSVAGARWWREKRKRNPNFQSDIMDGLRRLHLCLVAMRLPFLIILPASTRARVALGGGDVMPFDPCDYGGWLEENREHPLFPLVVPSQDAYKLKSLMVVGGGLRRPVRRPVPPVFSLVITKTRKTKRVCPLLALRKHKKARNVPPLGLVEGIVSCNSQ